MKKVLLLIIVLSVSLSCIYAYEEHEPIFVEDIHATAENPYIIEGYEISSNTANCIEVRDSEHVIIRNNYLHDCNWSKDDPLSWTEGRAIVVKNSEDILIENNTLRKNKIGIFAYKADRARILKNDIRETQVVGSLKCEYCEDSEIAYNYLLDNGRPDWFWVPGNRIIGIWVAASNNIDIHDNIVIRSSSDGIGISGTIDSSLEEPGKRDWKGVSTGIKVYNNVLLDNLELGIWLARIEKMECFNNTIRDHFGPIVIDFDIKNSEFYNNKLLSWAGGPIGLGIAKDNYVHDNIAYSVEDIEFNVPPGDEPGVNDKKFEWSGIDPYSSSGNIFENNEVRLLEGDLRDALESKTERAMEEDIFEEKGWFACEIEEGVTDKECVAREVAKGNQGMPKDLFVFEPLMENFDEYVSDSPVKKDLQKIQKENNLCEECDYTMEKTYAALFLITLVILIYFIIRKSKKQEKNL